MKRAKDKYMINRTKYKDIKRYDHKQMEDFLTDVYKNGYADGKESVPGRSRASGRGKSTAGCQGHRAGRVEQNQGASGRAFQEGAAMKELTIEELKQMPGQPVWCPEEEAYGIVMCDKIGQWAGIPFLHGVWYSDDDGVGVEFNHNIIGRKLKCFRVEDKKEIAMPPQNKEIGFGDQTLACPNCGQSAIVNPFRKDREIYPYCPWCGQKLKEAEDEQTK